MELELIRTYFPQGTNGELYFGQERICYTIELPWLNNKPGVSCIPEGRYELVKRFSVKYKWHLHVMNVVGRSLILIHCANNALKQLNGCIAPVSILTAAGCGLQSRVANNKLHRLVFPAITSGTRIFITVQSKSYETK